MTKLNHINGFIYENEPLNKVCSDTVDNNLSFMFTRKMMDITESISNNNKNTLIYKARMSGMSTYMVLYALAYLKHHKDSGKIVWIVSPNTKMNDDMGRKLSLFGKYETETFDIENKGAFYLCKFCGGKIYLLNGNMNPRGFSTPDIVFFDEFEFVTDECKKEWAKTINGMYKQVKVVEIATIAPKDISGYDELLIPKSGEYPYMEDRCLDIFDGGDKYMVLKDVDVFFINWYETRWGIEEGIVFTRNVNGTEVKIQLQRDEVEKMLNNPSGVIQTLTHEGWKITSPTLEKRVNAWCSPNTENIERDFEEIFRETIVRKVSCKEKEEYKPETTVEDIIAIFANPLFWESVFAK